MSDRQPCDCPPVEGLRNPPGQDRIAHRASGYGDTLHRTTRGIATVSLPDGSRPLAGLPISDPGDPTLALLDAFACMTEVLGSYQERVANEAFQRTAAERLSLVELGRLLGHRPDPGLAATVWLSFFVQPSPYETDQRAVVVAGTPAMSIPGPEDDGPQTFETSAELEAWASLNEVLPVQTSVISRLTAVRRLLAGDVVWFESASLTISPGDGIVYQIDDDDARTVEGTVLTVASDPIGDAVGITADFQGVNVVAPGAQDAEIFWFAGRMRVFGHDAPLWESMPESAKAAQFGSLATGFNGSPTDLDAAVQLIDDALESSFDPLIDEINAALGNGPSEYPKPLTFEFPPPLGTYVYGWDFGPEWPNYRVWRTTDENKVSLNGERRTLLVDSKVWMTNAHTEEDRLFDVIEVTHGHADSFGRSGPVTRIRVSSDPSPDTDTNSIRRDAQFMVESTLLQPARQPLDVDISGNTLLLDILSAVIPEGRLVVIRGLTDQGDRVSELRTVVAVDVDDDRTLLTLDASLDQVYIRSDTVVLANVASATHGRTTEAILGDGQPQLAHQVLLLPDGPQTWVPAPTATGRASTLEVRVDGEAWEATDALPTEAADALVYGTSLSLEGREQVRFGDGQAGARPPLGFANIEATWRIGLGTAGNVKAEAIALLPAPPALVVSVTNPLAASGGVNAESSESLRAALPSAVSTLGRVVSLTDYTIFARGFAGIGRARADRVHGPGGAQVIVSVLASDGTEIASTDRLMGTLRGALEAVSDPGMSVRIASAPPVAVELEIGLQLDADVDADEVLEAVNEALQIRYGIEGRDFGQGIAGSDVLALLHPIPGVGFVDLDRLERAIPLPGPAIPLPPIATRASAIQPLPARLAADGSSLSAELLVLGAAALVVR